ncbi:MAG: OmpA family protein [Archangium sp.]
MYALLAATVLVVAADPAVELEGNRLKLPQPILFETGKASLKPESDAMLELVKGYLEQKSYISTLRIEVHSDNQGNAEANQKLTEARAAAVFTALVKKGIDCKRLIAVGFGSTKPVADNSTPEGKAQNRRTDFFNAALKGRAIGGLPLDGGGVVSSPACP